MRALVLLVLMRVRLRVRNHPEHSALIALIDLMNTNI